MAEEKELDLKQEKRKKTIFVIRAILWFLFAAGCPFAFIAWRYGIFTTTTKTSITGFGIIAIVIFAIVLITLGSYIYKGMKPGLIKQCIHGAITVVAPLVAFYFIINSVSSNMEIFKQAMGCVILCETIAIPVNPFPVWLAEKEITKIENVSDLVWDRFFKRKNENESK